MLSTAVKIFDFNDRSTNNHLDFLLLFSLKGFCYQLLKNYYQVMNDTLNNYTLVPREIPAGHHSSLLYIRTPSGH